MSTPNGQKVQILLEELALAYSTTWTTTTLNIMTNEQKKEWFLRLNPNGRIPVLIDNTQTPPFPVMETSAELLYLLKFADKEDRFGFKDELERNQCLQWLFFWHGSGAPYQGQVNHFTRVAPEKIECLFPSPSPPNPLSLTNSPQTQLTASATKPSASTACWSCTSQASTRPGRVTTSPATARASTLSPTSGLGRGSRVGRGRASPKRTWLTIRIY
jgi:Glutathione S-transferase, N-terminal domain